MGIKNSSVIFVGMKLCGGHSYCWLFLVVLSGRTCLEGRGILKWAAQKGGSVLGRGGSASDKIVHDSVDRGRDKGTTG